MWKKARENAVQANRKVALIESEKKDHPGMWKRNLASREAHLESAKKHRDACEADEVSKLKALDAAKEKIINSQAPPSGAVVVLKSQALAVLISKVQIDEEFGTTSPLRTVNEVGKRCAFASSRFCLQYFS
jgi:hypothetical protein